MCINTGMLNNTRVM